MKEQNDLDLRQKRQELHDIEYRRVDLQQCPKQFSLAWRDGLEAKYRGSRAKLPDIPECSSAESLAPYAPEIVESYDLQFILYDFDFEGRSTFKMRPGIEAADWEAIRMQRLDLE